MAGGSFQTSREIFEHPIWQDVTQFRLFFYIYGQAIFSEAGVRVGDVVLKRGQYLRSYRNLSKDLEYIENRQVKSYSISTIKRTIDKLVKENRLSVEDTELGTLFTVVNYASYQGFGHVQKEDLAQHGNSVGTEAEQSRNNNKKEKKVKKDIKDYTSQIKDLLSRYKDVDGFTEIHKKYWDVIRETRTTGKIAESVIVGAVSKWDKYDKVVVLYSLKTHIEAHAGKKENYTIGIMRGTTKDEAEDRLSQRSQLALGQPKRHGGFLELADKREGIE